MTVMAQDERYRNFDEYIRQGEPAQRERAEAWRVAIGLQAVDGLKTSEYLHETARRNIEGEITVDEARELVKQYYITKTTHDKDDAEKEEADRVSSNITKILSTKTFDFSTGGLIALHRRIFEGVFKHAGQVRDYDITKKEWVLDGDTVNYLNWEDLRRALDYDLEKEKQFSYKDLEHDEMVKHIAGFVSGLWQIHPFGEGNTRTTAVFTILYLRHMGFEVSNDMFAEHSWYFRNALVRANYKNAIKGIDYSPVYLERFFRNLLLREQWDLRNRYLHILPTQQWSEQPNLADKVEKMADKRAIQQEMVDKWSIKASLAKKMVDILTFASGRAFVTTTDVVQQFGYSATTAKRYLRQLVECGYLETHGANKNKTYSVRMDTTKK